MNKRSRRFRDLSAAHTAAEKAAQKGGPAQITEGDHLLCTVYTTKGGRTKTEWNHE